MFLKIIMLHISKSYLWCLKDQRDPTSPFWRRSALGFLWREWCWSWNSSTLSTSCEELTHWKRLWCWERSGAGGEGDDRGWDGWMASLTSWTWFWVNSGSFCDGQGGLACCDSWGRRVEHDWGTELNWTELKDQRAWQSTPIFLPGEIHGQRTLVTTVYKVAVSWTRLSNWH